MEGRAEEGEESALRALASRPILQTIEMEAWNAFNRLSSRRPISGFGALGSIPYGEMFEYLDKVARITAHDDRDFCVELIEHLDGLYLKEVYEKQEQERKKQVNKPPLRSTRR